MNQRRSNAGPSGFVFWNRGVGYVGADAAGFTLHLLPAFATVLAIVFLGEPFARSMPVGIATIIAGSCSLSVGSVQHNGHDVGQRIRAWGTHESGLQDDQSVRTAMTAASAPCSRVASRAASFASKSAR